MKQLKRLKNMLSGGNKSENQKKTEEQPQPDPEMKTEEQETKPTETPKDVSEKPAETAPEKETETKAVTPDEKTKEAKKTEKPVEKTTESKEEKSKEEKPQTKRSDSMTLLEGREEDTITRDNIDVNFKQEVMDAGADTLALCFQCGTCTGACPSGRRTPYRIRQIVRKSLMGFKDDVISDDALWMCTTCYECQERCPRGIKIVDIVKIVRNYAAQAGYMAQSHKAVGSFVLKTGHAVPINPATQDLRKQVGLDELPPTTHSFPGALEEVQKITKATGFDNLIGYNWEKGELE